MEELNDEQRQSLAYFVEIITKNIEDSTQTKIKSAQDNLASLVLASFELVQCFKANRKLLIFGNGGSAADAQHIAAEFTGRFQCERRPLPAIALSTNSSQVTAIGNDYGFDQVFARPLTAMGQAGDFAWGISTSGNSSNVIAGIKKAKELGLKTITLTGCGGGELGTLGDYNLIVPSYSTPRIQESHIFMYHTICEIVEIFFSE